MTIFVSMARSSHALRSLLGSRVFVQILRSDIREGRGLALPSPLLGRVVAAHCIREDTPRLPLRLIEGQERPVLANGEPFRGAGSPITVLNNVAPNSRRFDAHSKAGQRGIPDQDVRGSRREPLDSGLAKPLPSQCDPCSWTGG